MTSHQSGYQSSPEPMVTHLTDQYIRHPAVRGHQSYILSFKFVCEEHTTPVIIWYVVQPNVSFIDFRSKILSETIQGQHYWQTSYYYI